jgi:hypothetical protein
MLRALVNRQLTNERLASRPVANFFFLASIAVILLILLALVPSLRLPDPLPPWLGVLVLTLELLVVAQYLGMWRYWLRLDHSAARKKKVWFFILLFGLQVGSTAYFFMVYLPQVNQKTEVA